MIFSFGPINILSFNQPIGGFGPNVNTTLTNKPAGSYFSERKFLEIQKLRKPPPPPPRKLSAKERADLNLHRLESEARSLPSSTYGRNDSISAAQVRDNLQKARKDRDHEYYMEIVKNEWAKFKNAR